MEHFYTLKNFDLSDDHGYTEGLSRSHIILRWNSRWLYPDFATHLKNLVHRVDNDPMLMKVKDSKQKMRTAIELLSDIKPSTNNFADNRRLTASPFCPCEETDETATHFIFDCTVYGTTNRPAKNFNMYYLRDCLYLVEFIITSGSFD